MDANVILVIRATARAALITNARPSERILVLAPIHLIAEASAATMDTATKRESASTLGMCGLASLFSTQSWPSCSFFSAFLLLAVECVNAFYAAAEKLQLNEDGFTDSEISQKCSTRKCQQSQSRTMQKAFQNRNHLKSSSEKDREQEARSNFEFRASAAQKLGQYEEGFEDLVKNAINLI